VGGGGGLGLGPADCLLEDPSLTALLALFGAQGPESWLSLPCAPSMASVMVASGDVIPVRGWECDDSNECRPERMRFAPVIQDTGGSQQNVSDCMLSQ
jgi:hypothetical protein